MEVSEELYEWLRETNLFRLDPPMEPPELPESLLNNFLDGSAIASLISYLREAGLAVTKKKGSTLTTDLSKIQTDSSPASKINNWGVLGQALTQFGIRVDADTKNLIIAGDYVSVVKVVEYLYKVSHQDQASPLSPDKGVHIESLDVNKPLFEAESCLEMLLLSFCHHFSVSPKQAAGLLTQKNKYLAQILVKGIKGNLTCVNEWLQDLASNTGRLLQLLSRETLPFVLNILKPGLASKSPQVVDETLQLFISISAGRPDLLEFIWKWFSAEPLKLLLSLLNTQARLPLVLQLIGTLGSSHYAEFFSRVAKRFASRSEYLHFVKDVIDIIQDSKQLYEDFAAAGVISGWAELAFAEGESELPGIQSVAISFLVYLTTRCFQYLSQNNSFLSSLIALLNKVSRTGSHALRLSAVSNLSYLLDFFVKHNNPASGVAFRAATFLLVETFDEPALREHIQANLSVILRNTPTAPVSLLLDPMVKRMQVAPVNIEVFDIAFFLTIAEHPRLTLRQALQFIDLVAKRGLSDLVHARACGVVFTHIAWRFVQDSLMQEYLYLFCKYALTLVLNTEEFNSQYKLKKRSFNHKETEMMEELLQQRNFIMELVTWVVQQWRETLNGGIKRLIIELNTSFQERHQYDCKPFQQLIKLLGGSLHPPVVQSNSPEPTPEPPRESTPPPQPAKKKPYFPWERAFGDVERAKQRFSEKQQREREEAERKIREFEAQQKKVKKQLEIRKLEQGRLRQEARPIFSEGVAQKYATQEEYELREFSAAEQEEYNAVKLLLKKYSRVFKVWFQSYSGTGFAHKLGTPGSEFEWLAARKERINEAEYVKLFIDHGVIPKLMTKEELKVVMKAYIHKHGNQGSVNYQGFKNLFSQLAWFIYSKPCNDCSHLPPVFSVKALIMHMRQAVKQRNASTDLFDEPDPGAGDKEVVRSLNKSLQDNPFAQLPPGYIRFTDVDMSLHYFLPSTLGIPDSFMVCYEIVDEIIHNAFSVRLLEPQLIITVGYRAKGVKPKKEPKALAPIHERPYERRFKSQTPAPLRPKGLSISSSPAIKLSAPLRFAIAQAPVADKPLMEVCAHVVEDLVHRASVRVNRALNRSHQSEIRYEVRKKKQLEDLEEQRKRDKVRFAQRKMELKEMLFTAKIERERKLNSDAEQRRVLLAQQQAKKAYQSERAKQAQAIRKQQLAEYYEIKRKEEEQRIAEEQAHQELLRQQRLKDLEEVKKKNNKKLKQFLKQQARKNRVDKVKEDDSQNRDFLKRVATRALEVAKHEALKESQWKIEVAQTLQHPETTSIFSLFRYALQEVFVHFARQTSALIEYDLMDFEAFNRFAVQFGITPSLLTPEETKWVFNVLTKDNINESAGKLTINITEFERGLVLIASRSKTVFQCPTTVQALQCLIDYFDLPEDTRALHARLTLSSKSRNPQRRPSQRLVN